MTHTISIFGLGYVGTVTAGCLAERGHRVIGVDVQPAKVAALDAGRSPIIEPQLDELLHQAHVDGLLRATTDTAEAVAASEISIVCVGTPQLDSGRLNLDFVRKVSSQIAAALTGAPADKKHTLIFRSTMLPGSSRTIVAQYFEPLLADGRLQIFYVPEFLREGTAVKDFRDPSLSALGTHDGTAPQDAEATLLFSSHVEILTWEGAEMLKYASNYFHALKVGFANEIGRVCKHVGEDGTRVMDILCQDTRLNISRTYMKPGNPFGGSCLPKDVNALSSFSRMEGVNLPLLDHTIDTNRAHLDSLITLVCSREKRKVGLLGLAFKMDTDDLRGSPMVTLAETLLGRGYELHIYDPQLNLSRLVGANEAEINRRMPHLAQLLRSSAQEVIEASEIIVASQACASISDLAAVVTPEHFVIDVNGWAALRTLPWHYEGICW